jgi:hypothetical protein
MPAANPTLDALSTLCTEVPEWNDRLDKLNGQIALRQIELARLEEERPATQSLRNKGSTESLRPKDGEASHPTGEVDPDKEMHSPAITKLPDGSNPTSAPLPFPLKPDPIPCLITWQQTTATPPAPYRPAPAPAKPVKRVAESLASAETAAPKCRTRSMIIVYYDSAVQTAFAELVKFVSGSRSAMRKGKMAAKMAEMRRAAEMEVEADGDGDDDANGTGMPQLGDLFPRKKAAGKDGGRPIAKLEEGPPTLRFSSTRQVGPGKESKPDNLGDALNVHVLRSHAKSSNGIGDLFDKIDKALEWCQSHCEYAAHKFLREGECSKEIENIKKKLSEVQQSAKKEVQNLKSRESVDGSATPSKSAHRGVPLEGETRERPPMQIRRDSELVKAFNVDNMEVDDEGVEDPGHPILKFKRSRDRV